MHTLEVSDIFQKHGSSYRQTHNLPVNQLRAMRSIEICRTKELGGHIDKCDSCERERISYNSCRNRHCPKCQFIRKEKWIEARCETLLPIKYFHVVTTIPHLLNPLALRNQKIIYNILFRATKETLLELARDQKHIGANIGFMSILHTWGQNLSDHPHIHSIVTGGGISTDNSKWINSRKKFFLPIEVISKLFKGKFLFYLKNSFETKQLNFPGKISYLENKEHLSKLLRELYKKNWIAYCKPPFRNTEKVIEYLSRYTHRVAICNNRIISMNNDKVTFSWKDYADNNKKKEMALEAEEFIRRFLLHILPDKFVKIRYYGFMGNRNRKTIFKQCCKLLRVKHNETEEKNRKQWQEFLREKTGLDILQCPYCKKGIMYTVQTILPKKCHGP